MWTEFIERLSGLRQRGIKASLRRFVAEDEAQATTEYILMLTVAVALFFLVVKNFVVPMMNKLSDSLSAQISAFFQPRNLHQIRLKR